MGEREGKRKREREKGGGVVRGQSIIVFHGVMQAILSMGTIYLKKGK